jgi:hypothetical protein
MTILSKGTALRIQKKPKKIFLKKKTLKIDSKGLIEDFKQKKIIKIFYPSHIKVKFTNGTIEIDQILQPKRIYKYICYN